jgi:hypothetical protein
MEVTAVKAIGDGVLGQLWGLCLTVALLILAGGHLCIGWEGGEESGKTGGDVGQPMGEKQVGVNSLYNTCKTLNAIRQEQM